MITNLLKKSLEKVMKGELNILFTANMCRREVEDQNFQGLTIEKLPQRTGGDLSDLPVLQVFGTPTEESAPSSEWANRILGEMTWEEKVSFISGYSSIAIQPIPRLGLPSIWSSDATSGLRCFEGGTAYPAAIAMAATWNQDLIEKLGTSLGEEARAKGISILLGPGINIYRIPTNGRNFEYMGEDPFLAGKIAAGYIRGVQSRGVITTVKHFVCNNSEYDRHKCDSVVDERTLREIYLPAFKRAIKEGGARGVMSAYNPVNGVYASENNHLLMEILRGEWGFDGIIMSDWDSLYATAGPVKNGLDIEMPGAKWLTMEKLQKEIASGTISEKDIETMVYRLLFTLHSSGVYSRPQIDKSATAGGEAHAEIALATAREGIILLKNVPPAGQKEPLLPLNTDKINTMVVLGRTAMVTPTGGGGSSLVPVSQKGDIVRGIIARLEEEGKGIKIHYIPYKKRALSGKSRELIRSADAVIMCAGFHSFEETECFDRTWELPENQGKLIKKVTALNPNTAVVLTAGGGVETESWLPDVPALLHSLYLGQSVGTAVSEILFGKITPSGKLPFTMAKRWTDFASASYYVDNPGKFSPNRVFIGQGDPGKRKTWQMKYDEKLMVGYRNFDTMKVLPQFPFGHGLSYTSFEISEMKVSKPLLKERQNRKVSLVITNTGAVEGAQTIQIYIKDHESTLPRPEKELKGFVKVFLKPGESEKISLTLTPEDFSYFNDEKMEWVCEAGLFTILAGFSSRDIRAEETCKI
ncbi:MAG: glycoside hydrolase family 3 C-terminal domain-containing protein [Spirochaetales bacterium]|nr:glycoside hydrolase family 3 C-terminal domain-containing protein [Spirochaetales bacterium]